MNAPQAMRLLARCAAFDNRRPNEAAAQAWSAALHDVPFDADCATAVARYYGTPPADPEQRKWIEPHHVRSLRAKIREERAAAAGEGVGPGLGSDVPDADPDDVPAYLAALRQGRVRAAEGRQLLLGEVAVLTASVGRPVPGPNAEQREQLAAAVPRFAARPARTPQLAVACDKCGARQLAPCTRPSGAELTDHTHHARRAAWVTATTPCAACHADPGEACRNEHGEPLPELIHGVRDRDATPSVMADTLLDQRR